MYTFCMTERSLTFSETIYGILKILEIGIKYKYDLCRFALKRLNKNSIKIFYKGFYSMTFSHR